MQPTSDATDSEFDLRDYIAVLRRRKGVVALAAVVVVAAALAFSFLQTPVYRASAEVLLQERSVEDVLNEAAQQQNPQAQQAEVQTEIEVMQSRLVKDAVAEDLGYSPEVSISAEGETNVVSISADDTDASKAAREANTYAETYVEVRRTSQVEDLVDGASEIQAQIDQIDSQLNDLDNRLQMLDAEIADTDDAAEQDRLRAERAEVESDSASQRTALQSRREVYAEQLDRLQLSANLARTGGARIVSEAATPSSPISPDPVRNGALALVLGLLLGVGLAFLFEYLDDTIRSKEDLDRATGGLDVLGLVPQVPGWKDRKHAELISVDAPNSSAAEAYRALRTSLQFIGIDREVRLLQVTSASAAEGKTTTLANLAVAFARAGQQVLAVDCDLRRPRLHEFFGVDNDLGFTSVILGEVPLAEAIQAVPDQARLQVLATGPPPPNPYELLATRSARDLIASLTGMADYVLIDCPPVLPVADARVISSAVEATILIATAGSTHKRSTGRAVEVLHQVDAPLVGTVLNSVDPEAGYAYGGYAYGYGYTNGRADARRGFGRRAPNGQTPGEEPALPAAERDPTGRFR